MFQVKLVDMIHSNAKKISYSMVVLSHRYTSPIASRNKGTKRLHWNVTKRLGCQHEIIKVQQD